MPFLNNRFVNRIRQVVQRFTSSTQTQQGSVVHATDAQRPQASVHPPSANVIGSNSNQDVTHDGTFSAIKDLVESILFEVGERNKRTREDLAKLREEIAAKEEAQRIQERAQRIKGRQQTRALVELGAKVELSDWDSASEDERQATEEFRKSHPRGERGTASLTAGATSRAEFLANVPSASPDSSHPSTSKLGRGD